MKQTFRVLGLMAFMASLTLLGWWWLRLGTVEAHGVRWRAAVWDTALFSGFALHHSLLARRFAAQVVARLVTDELVRSVYVWMASLLLVMTCVLWRPLGGVVYEATGVASILLMMMQALGAVVGLLTIRRMDVGELAGLRSPDRTDDLQQRGPYRLVRHPLYLGWVLFFFGTTYMTGDRLLFAAVSTAYLLVAMPFEEAGLVRQFGSRYLEYRQAVRWRLIPYIH
jgi:methanethiol S-methyltransferase